MAGESTSVGKNVKDPEPNEVEATNAPCVPYGAAITETKPYWYIVQAEDIGSFWQVPTKFNLPAQKAGGTWTWQDLRNANLDWPGGFGTVNEACVLWGLFPGAKLHVPASWPEPKPGVQIEPKKNNGFPGGTPTKGTATAAIVVGIIGIVGIGALAYAAHKQNRRRA